jgi:hypothetical protein
MAHYGHDALVELDLVPSTEPVLTRLTGENVPASGTRARLQVHRKGAGLPGRLKLVPHAQRLTSTSSNFKIDCTVDLATPYTPAT